MSKHSAGLLVYRRTEAGIEVFLVHPGGPFFAKKDLGAWTIPKGELAEGEEPLVAAQREFAEETGFALAGPFLPLGAVRQAGGKVVQAFATVGSADIDPEKIVSNTFQVEWPPRSGRMTNFPEVDRAGWFSLALAAEKINAAQAEFLTRLEAQV